MYVGMRLRYPAFDFARLLKYKYIEYTYQTELLTRNPQVLVPIAESRGYALHLRCTYICLAPRNCLLQHTLIIN